MTATTDHLAFTSAAEFHEFAGTTVDAPVCAHENKEPSWKCLEDGRARWRQVPDAPTAFMTGAAQAWQNNKGLIRLQYTDGTEEFALCPEIDLGVEDNWMRIVMHVQDKRGDD